MRTMLTWAVPVERGNQAIEDGSLAATIEEMLDKLEPEAAYFRAIDGERGGMIVFDMDDPAQIPQVAEPLFLKLDASVELTPVMNADDLRRALSSL